MTKRKSLLNNFKKLTKLAESDQHGFFQNFQSTPVETSTRDEYLSKKNNKPVDKAYEALYGLSPDHEDSEATIGAEVSPHLSTRYCPGWPGLMARHISSGVYQNPITGEMYDYNEGFKTDGKSYAPGDISMQTSLLHFAGHLDSLGMIKQADYVDGIIKAGADITIDQQLVVGAGLGVPGIMSMLLLGTILSADDSSAWNMIPERTRMALETAAGAIRLLPEAIGKDLKDGLRASLTAALLSLEEEPKLTGVGPT
jgi:hypothetical protein